MRPRFELVGSATTPGTDTLLRLQDLAPHYEIVRELGRGGTSIVYQARERELERDVAIKVVRPTYLDDAEAVARLAREARLVALLRHPNIVPLFGTRHLSDGSLALVMQYVPGRTLKQAIREDGPLPVATAARVLRDVALALQYAHVRHGIIHRDIKPENIYLDADLERALLADFGIARAQESESSLTLVGSALGTPAYMSPEQVDGEHLDARSDLYSLGLVAWEMLSGQQPWDGQTLYNIIYSQKHEALAPLSQFREDVPPQLQQAIDGLLQKDRSQRFADAGPLLDLLEPLVPEPAAAPRLTQRVETAPAAVPVDDALTVYYRRDAVGGAARVPDATRRPPAPAAAPRRRSRRFLYASLLVAAGVGAVLIGVDNIPQAIAEWLAPPEEAAATQPQSSPPVTATVEVAPASSGAPARLLLLAGEEQRGQVGATLPMPLAVQVEDSLGRRVPGVTVRFTPAPGSGVVAPAEVITTEFGSALANWTLGAQSGAQEVTVTVGEEASVSVVFHALAEAVPPTAAADSAAAPEPAASGTRLPVRAGVFAGGTHTCVLDAAGEAQCWGGNDAGQLGAGTQTRSSGTERVQTSLSFSRLAAGMTHSCGLDRAGAAHCWGANESGQLGTGDRNARAAPAAVRGVTVFSAIAAGRGHTCALDDGGSAWCWGAGGNGQLGDGSGSDRSTPVRVAGGHGFDVIAAGWRHTCALAGGSAWCWGMNGEGQLGDGSRSDRAAPVRVQGEQRFTAIAAGAAHTCALAGGAAYCWGQGRSEPVRLPGDVSFASIIAGAVHTCALTSAGEAYCWGRNNAGQLGTGDTQDAAAPVPVAGGLRFAALSASGSHTCGRTHAGEQYCWGYNLDGQLGDGTRSERLRPTPVRAGIRGQ